MNRISTGMLSGLLSGPQRKATVILLWAPVVMTVWKYYGTGQFYLTHLASSFVIGDPARTAELYTFGSAFLLFGVLSLLAIRFVFKEPLSHYGIALGDWKFTLKAILVVAPVFALLSFPSSKDPQFLAEYPLFKGAAASAGAFAWHALAYLFFYAGWEIFFRGFMQFGLRDALGDWNAIFVQTALSCVVHIGKPDGEIFSAILGGLLWGILAFRSRSLVANIATHWVLGVSLDLYICFF